MKPICIACQRFYRMKKGGVWFLEGMPTTSRAYPGTAEPNKWKPYKLWMGDLWQCQGCGHKLISGVAREPLSEHYKPDFKEYVEKTQPIVQVNDC